MALNIKIINEETFNSAVVKVYTPGGKVKRDEIIKPKGQKEYVLYGTDHIEITQN